MAFNHYAKIKRIVDSSEPGWYVSRINEPTSAKNFKGETRQFDHYYRVYSAKHQPLKYCKFQQLDLFLKQMKMQESELSISD